MMNDSLGKNKKRTHLYHCSIVGGHGTLGCIVCFCIIDYVVVFSCSMCPDPDDTYMGHHDGNGDDVQTLHKDNRNESIESTLPDGNIAHRTKNINFNAGEKMKIFVSFENSVVQVDAMRCFISVGDIF